jgi:hypothetical protein
MSDNTNTADEDDFLGTGDASAEAPKAKPRARKAAKPATAETAPASAEAAPVEPELVAAEVKAPAIPEMEVEVLRKYVPAMIKTADGTWVENQFDEIVGSLTTIEPGTPDAPVNVTLQMNEAVRAIRAGIVQPISEY